MHKDILDKVLQAEELFGSSEICREELLKTAALREKLENQELTISVIGQFKRGKSTLVNAMLGEKLLPVGIVPVTSVVTTIKYGEPSTKIHFDNGVIEDIEFDQLSKYVNEQENPGNKYGVSSVSLTCQSEFLRDGLTFVDTPGVGSVHKHNTDAAYAFVKESDAVIFMISVDSPINEIEINFLKNAKDFAAKFYFAVNKVDNVEPEELEVYLDYCRKLICSLMEVEDVMLFPVSAKKGQGIQELQDKIKADCQAGVKDILMESTAMKLKDIIKTGLSKLDLYWNALKLPTAKLDERFQQMSDCLDELEEESRRVADSVEASGSEYYQVSNTLEIKLNEMRRKLAAQVSELFGMEYHYELTELNVGEKYRFDSSQDDIGELKERFLKEARHLCNQLNDTLNLILLYKEKNTITVARRIDDLNKLSRHLRSLRVKL